jgi:pimeloyl-ACP methyl ester carboxylesterase
MTIRKLVVRGLLAVLVLLSVAAAAVSSVFIHDRAELLARREVLSSVVATSRGPVEYAEIGHGPPALYMHGTPGGYDQSYLVLRAEYADAGPPFRAIVPSRPGYLRTPIDAGRTFADQADAMAALLDALQIARVAVVGISGGGPAALQFAIRHPGRCSSLILGSAVTQRMTSEVPWLLEQAPRDFITWIAGFVFKARFASLQQADPIAGQMWSEMLRSSYPHSERETGFTNDMAQIGSMAAVAFGEIRCPTLIMHGTADDNVPFTHAELASRGIAGARLVRFEGQDHFASLSKRREWEATMHEFLMQHAGEPATEHDGVTRVAPDSR